MFENSRIRKIVVVQKFRNQPAYDELVRHFGPQIVTFTTDFDDDVTSLENLGPPSTGSAIIVLDDVLHLFSKSQALRNLIVGGCHHNK